jgi:hypothetical protein
MNWGCIIGFAVLLASACGFIWASFAIHPIFGIIVLSIFGLGLAFFAFLVAIAEEETK